MNNLQWIFDGIGTAIVSAIFGLFIGGLCGYKIGFKKSTVKQKQKAGNNSTQVQIGIQDGGK